MQLERPQLFTSGREWLLLLGALAALLLLSLAFEYHRYHELTRFNDAIVDADVLTQYVKSKKGKRYSVLKMQSGGVQFYTTASEHLRDLRGRTLRLRMRTDRMEFSDYLSGFFAFSTIEKVYPSLNLQERLRRSVAFQHDDTAMRSLYGALFAASPMNRDLREKLSVLGISHLLAISGFHLGVISVVLFLLPSWPYRMLQQRWFPWRNRRRDIVVLSVCVMLFYLWVLGFVPSLLRAFAMLVVGYLLYDRGIKVVSMQTLAISVLLLLALWPRLFFSFGFWLSVAGVYNIFLFLQHTQGLKPWQQLVGISVWVYLAMLPAALYLFGQFGPWHPLSVLWTLLFNLFYPVAALLHLFQAGALLDVMLSHLLRLSEAKTEVIFPLWAFGIYLVLSMAAMRYRKGFYLLGVFVLAVFVGAVYEVA